MIALRYKIMIGQLDLMQNDNALFLQELANLIVQSSIETSRSIATPNPKENAAQHRTRLRKMSKSKLLIDRLAHWYYTQSQLLREG